MPFSITGTRWIQWQGLEELQEALNEVTESTNVAANLIALGDQIVQEMQAIAPVDTGFMRDEIAVTEVSDDAIRIEAQAAYSGFVEYGTRFQEPQPFFEPAIENLDATTVVDDVTSSWEDTIAKHNPFRGGFKTIGRQLLT